MGPAALTCCCVPAATSATQARARRTPIRCGFLLAVAATASGARATPTTSAVRPTTAPAPTRS